MRILLAILFILTSSFSCFSQGKIEPVAVEEMAGVLKSVRKFYKQTSNYRFDVYYFSYKGHESSIPFEESTGYFIKSGNNYRYELMGVEAVQNDEFLIAIQKEYKKVMVNNVSEDNDALKIKEMELSLSKIDKIYKSVLGNLVTYHLYYNKNSSVSQTDIKIVNNEYIERIIFFFSKAQSWENEKGEKLSAKPRLEVIYKNFRKNLTVNQEDFYTSRYLKTEGNILKIAEKYKGYELLDLRINK